MKLAASGIFLRSALPLLAICLVGSLSSVRAAENISGFMDATGRVVFANETSQAPEV